MALHRVMAAILRHFTYSGTLLQRTTLNHATRPRASAPKTVNKIIYKFFGAMAKDSYGQISEYFSIPSVEQLITNRHNRFLNRYRCQENY